MIKITRINGSEFYLNPELIEHLEETPDTVITLTGGKTFMVKESAKLIIKKIIEYRRHIHKIPKIKK